MTTTTPTSDLLDPQALAAVANMELVAHQVMDGYIQGMHKSPHIGFALDFAQHRQYAPGDDIKRIDWRAYAKSDRYYIKQYEVTTSLKAHLVVDASGSMAYRGTNGPLSKFRYAQFTATCLAYLILRQQDSVGLATFSGGSVDAFIPARSASPHLFTLARTLDAATPHPETSTGGISTVLHDLAERLGHRQMVIVISDLFDNTEKLLQAFHHLRHKRHEVILLQIIADDELTFPFRSFTLFENLETRGRRNGGGAQKLRLDPATVRGDYLANLSRHLKAIRDEANTLRISHALFKTTDSLEKSLTTYLAQRMGSR